MSSGEMRVDKRTVRATPIAKITTLIAPMTRPNQNWFVRTITLVCGERGERISQGVKKKKKTMKSSLSPSGKKKLHWQGYAGGKEGHYSQGIVNIYGKAPLIEGNLACA